MPERPLHQRVTSVTASDMLTTEHVSVSLHLVLRACTLHLADADAVGQAARRGGDNTHRYKWSVAPATAQMRLTGIRAHMCADACTRHAELQADSERVRWYLRPNIPPLPNSPAIQPSMAGASVTGNLFSTYCGRMGRGCVSGGGCVTIAAGSTRGHCSVRPS